MATTSGPSTKRDRQDGGLSLPALERDAHTIADRLPDLLLEADRISSTVAHGIHGRPAIRGARFSDLD
jgi:hypothetical protein